MEILNYIDGKWTRPRVPESVDVINPATGEPLAKTPLCGPAEVASAAACAAAALSEWREVPVQERVQYLFALRGRLRENLDLIARTITDEAGKTLEESKAEMVRAIENVEIACGMPMLGKGEVVEDIAPGIDEIMLRQPVGVCATIAPFNFPGMIPFWYLPYAIACGNTYIVKPSEKVPMTMQLLFKLIEAIGLPRTDRSSQVSGPVTVPGLPEALSERELEVLKLIEAGRSNKEIADVLFLALGTVKKHTSNIFGKLGVESRTQAVARARELRLL